MKELFERFRRRRLPPGILTVSGEYFDYSDPKGNVVLIEDIAYGLSNMCRFGGQLANFYSVAQHSVHVSEILERGNQLWGLLHDASEAYMLDMPASLKSLLPDYRRLERKISPVIWGHFGLEGPMPQAVKDADLMLLSTEIRDLIPSHHAARWRSLDRALEGVEALVVSLEPWPPEVARKRFLERFYMIRSENVWRMSGDRIARETNTKDKV